MALIFDIVLLAVLAGTAVYYAKKGFLAGIVQLLGTLISLLGAYFASAKVSPAVFENFFKHGLVEKIRATFEAQSNLQIEEIVEKFAGFLPAGLKEKILETTAGLLDTSAPDAALMVVENVIAPLLVPIISLVVFFVTFALCRLLVKFVTAVLTGANKVPLLGGVNRLLGFVTGAGAGVLNVFLLLCAAWALLVITGGKSEYWNEEMLSASRFYRLFAPYNPFV